MLKRFRNQAVDSLHGESAGTSAPPHLRPRSDTTTTSEENAQSLEYEAFVSYSHSDEHLVTPLIQIMGLSGLKVFWDRHEIKPGDLWENRISQALAKSQRLVVLWCCDAANSEWVDREIHEARILNTRIVPILLCGFPLPPELAQFQWIDCKAAIHHNCSHSKSRLKKRVLAVTLFIGAALAALGSILFSTFGDVKTRGPDDIPLGAFGLVALFSLSVLWISNKRRNGLQSQIGRKIENAADRDFLRLLASGLNGHRIRARGRS